MTSPIHPASALWSPSASSWIPTCPASPNNYALHNYTIERAWSRDHATSSVTAVLPPPGQRCGTVCLNSFGNRTSPSDNSNDRSKRLCLVSWAAAPRVWTLRVLTRNLLTYLLTYLHLLTDFIALYQLISCSSSLLIFWYSVTQHIKLSNRQCLPDSFEHNLHISASHMYRITSRWTQYENLKPHFLIFVKANVTQIK